MIKLKSRHEITSAKIESGTNTALIPCCATKQENPKSADQPKNKNEIYRLVYSEKPKDETHWRCRTLAKKVRIGKTAVNLILQELGLQPHKVSKRNYSNDPDFEAKNLSGNKSRMNRYDLPPDNDGAGKIQ